MIKTDSELVTEARDILVAYVEKSNELLVNRGIVLGFQVNNGNDGKPASLASFDAIKKVPTVDQAAQDNTPTPSVLPALNT